MTRIQTDVLARTIQVFLAEGTPLGLRVASIHGWTGSVIACQQASFPKLLNRPEVNRTGIYILFGQEVVDEQYELRAYIGEADSVKDRIRQSADEHAFWETALVITTSDDALTKGHVRYLEARLIEATREADRVNLDNRQEPASERRYLPEADRANMEAFLASLAVILPVLGLDLLKQRVRNVPKENLITRSAPRFEIKTRSGLTATAIEQNGDFIVLQNSMAVKDSPFVGRNYAPLKEKLIKSEVLVEVEGKEFYIFNRDQTFTSVSAAAAVVLDRNANGRTEWKIPNSQITYAAWQETQEVPGVAA